MRNLFIILVLVIASCGVALAQTKPIGELRQMFDYDRSAPLDVKENGVEEKNGASIHNISYASPRGGRVTAYLVVPSGKKRKFAGVIFMHPKPGSRKTFLDEALQLAKAGAVSLLIDAPFSREGESKREFDPTVTKAKDDRDIYIQTVVDLRRGVDLLVSRSDIDPKRIGFIGHSYGAHTGASLAGVEKRIKAFVIMAGAPSLTEFLRTSTIPAIVETRNSLTKEQQENYFSTLAFVDPINYIGYVAPSALFLQFGKKDIYPNEETAASYAKAASNPKLVKFYDAGHDLNDEARPCRVAAKANRNRQVEMKSKSASDNLMNIRAWAVTLLSPCFFFLCLRIGGFVPHQLRRFAAESNILLPNCITPNKNNSNYGRNQQ